MRKYCLAIDIGASSGRHVIGWQENGTIQTEEIYRFPNGVSHADGHLVWDIDNLLREVIEGIRRAFSRYPTIESLAVDTWGVDYVLLREDAVILPVYAYRDGRTAQVIDEVHRLCPPSELYAKTGIQFQPFNSIYQLYADKTAGRLDAATDFLMIPEYLSYRLTGVKAHEYTNATTTGLINVATNDYDRDIVARLGLPPQLFSKPVSAGTVLGHLTEEVSALVGGQTNVVLCASHDTASAVAGAPIGEQDAFLSSGTWSLLGAKLPRAITSAESLRANYTNEGGVGYIRYLKNIMGMWVINNLRAELAPDKTFDELTAMAKESAFAQTVDLSDARFLAPDRMTDAIASCFASEEAPQTAADFLKCAHLSLAESYRRALSELALLTGRTYRRLCIVGGGAKNDFLNALTEEVCKICVVALPIEATAIGNLKLQMEVQI